MERHYNKRLLVRAWFLEVENLGRGPERVGLESDPRVGTKVRLRRE